MQIKELKNLFRQRLVRIYSARESEILFSLVAESVMNISKQDWLLKTDLVINPEEEKKINQCLDELSKHKPIQYVLGEAHFFGNKFLVNKSVLIPRPETEELVARVLETVRQNYSPEKKLNIIDIGTGSGCIAVSLKKNLNEARVSGMDISEKALETAKQNSLANQVNVDFICDDILNPENNLSESKFEIIVSNPPYVKKSEMQAMNKNVLDYEPHLALFVENADPLIFYQKIADFSQTHLKNNGWLFFEIHKNYGMEICQLLKEKNFSAIELKKDLQGMERMIRCRKN